MATSGSKSRFVGAALAALALAWLCSPGADAQTTPAAVIDRAEARFRALTDYECTAEIESRLGSKVESGACRFWFKQPRMLRARITRGSRRGSEVAVDRAGIIRGHQSGLFKRVVRKMKENDRRLLTIRGASLMGLDWGSFFLKYHAAALRPAARITLAPRAGAASAYQVQVAYPDNGKSIREIYSFDPERWLIVEGAVFEGDVRVEHVTFRDIKLDTGMPDSWFKL